MTVGSFAPGILAQSVGGGGGLLLDSRTVLDRLTLVGGLAKFQTVTSGYSGSTDSRYLTNGPGDGIRVAVGGTVTTTGKEAPAVMSVLNPGYSVLGGGPLIANTAIRNPSSTSLAANELTIDGSVQASGLDSPGVFIYNGVAVSDTAGRSYATAKASVTVKGLVMGGSGLGGYGIRVFSGGETNIVVEKNGRIGSLQNKAIRVNRLPAGDRPAAVSITNNGTII